MNSIKPIETYYKGYRFRSRLEARWAVFFDSLKIPWVYEPEGLAFSNGIHYLPDFYLPDCKQFFEVKGIMTPADGEKITALISAGYSVTIGREDGKFTACDHWGESDDGTEQFDLCVGSESWLCRCKDCGKYWFMGSNGIYDCQCCGAYDGDHHFDIVMYYYNYRSYNGKVEGCDTDLWDVARQARFEHDENQRPRKWIDYKNRWRY